MGMEIGGSKDDTVVLPWTAALASQHIAHL